MPNFAVGIALSSIGVGQACLTLLVANRGLLRPVYGRLLSDLTRTEQQFQIAYFFHTEDPNGYRLKKLAVASGLAGTIVSYCISLLVSAAGGIALTLLAVESKRAIGWVLGCIALVVFAIVLLATLLYRAAQDELQTFGMRLRGGGAGSGLHLLDLNTPRPYLSFQLLSVVFAALVGYGFSSAAPVPNRPPCPKTAGPPLPGAIGISPVVIAGCEGYYVADRSGQVSAFGSARWHGEVPEGYLNEPIISITATPDGNGYWMLGADGDVFTFGDAPFYGSTANLKLNAPVVGMAVTPDDKGYWIVARDGGIFTFGDAHFYGSTGNLTLRQPVVGIAVAPKGTGYWLVARDGGVFTFTPDGFYGSLGAITLNKPIIGISGTPDGKGYTLIGSDGGVFTFGDAHFYGSMAANPLPGPFVDLGPSPGGIGYYVINSSGAVYTFGPGAPYFGSV